MAKWRSESIRTIGVIVPICKMTTFHHRDLEILLTNLIDNFYISSLIGVRKNSNIRQHITTH